ncbi:damage-inducible protein DinB [Alteromonas sediminis]|uniref:Damage-inducible protein DinB n=1 Tax=Alteromonas sediminis TaxID=2259342 RepID=A0A3N5Y0P1_9ALTE|nr:DinB family protein [Alteromonas sediminis]RPJ66086.1 damage-inducible protein DinB [Alteromonas sediminis]
MDVKTYQYKQWADQRTLDAISSIDRTMFANAYSFSLQQISHMVIVEELFKSRLCALPSPHSATNSAHIPSFDTLQRRLIASGTWYVEFITSCEDLTPEISFVFVDGQRGKMSVGEILFHIINHGSYHRGNIAHALDLARVPHPIDGYGAFIHGLEPQRRET